MPKLTPKKYLLIQFRQIGDVILTTPIPRILRQHLPDAQIDFLTFQMNESIWRHNPHISNLITFDKKKGSIAFAKLLLQLRRNRYDAVLDFQNTPRSTYCALISGADYRVTWENSSRRMFYNTTAPRAEGYPSTAKSYFLRPFIPALDIESMPVPRPEVHFSETETRSIETIFDQHGISADDFVVSMAPTHRREVRRWPVNFFLEAAHFLIRKYNAKVILSWGPGEAEYIQKGLESGNYAHPNLISDLFLNLLEFSALMQKVRFHIGNDSAPLHLATAQNTPTFSIFGATTTTTWGYPSRQHACAAKNMDCQPCNKRRCIYGDAIPCLKEYGFEEIQPQLEKFIETEVLNRK